jgi:hypothetical protein
MTCRNAAIRKGPEADAGVRCLPRLIRLTRFSAAPCCSMSTTQERSRRHHRSASSLQTRVGSATAWTTASCRDNLPPVPTRIMTGSKCPLLRAETLGRQCRGAAASRAAAEARGQQTQKTHPRNPLPPRCLGLSVRSCDGTSTRPRLAIHSAAGVMGLCSAAGEVMPLRADAQAEKLGCREPAAAINRIVQSMRPLRQTDAEGCGTPPS